MSRSALAGLLTVALLAPAAALPVALATPAPALAAAPRTVTVVGDLQSELGCPGDWVPSCEATRLAPVEGSAGAYAGAFEVPAGTWSFKVALDGSWDEAHPAQDLPLVLEGPATLEFSFDDETDRVGVRPTALEGPATSADRALARDSLREAVTDEQFYFVMADRFANGDLTNDTAGIPGGRLDHGFDPTDKGFFHGGDLAGIMDRLDYIQGLGTTAIWLTPSFKNRPVQASGADASAGYHGYWVTDFTQIDPHLGTNEEMRALVEAAHARGMKVYFDIITNHTADVIDHAEQEYGYVSKEEQPYRDAAGNAFDDRDHLGKPFPLLDPATSFPYEPVFRTEADRTVKVPDWLNDPTMYHNRGDSTWAGESSTYGDFIGLDDLFTERQEVVDGMVEIYSAWAQMGIDGFRVDTVKHVNLEFWQEFTPRVLEAAREGDEDFFIFGEVFDGNPEYLSTFSTEGGLPAVIDFGFQGRVLDFARGAATTQLRAFYAQDDHYTDADSNAYQMPTFTGNHDMGRAAMMLAADHEGEDLQRRVELTNELMFLTRGQPVVYYGDEQGFIGAGGDKDARQDMFATQVESYATEPLVAAEPGSLERYDTGHPLYRQVATLGALVKEHPALADGAQVHRYASDQAGVYAFSRIDAQERVEYVVVANNATTPRSVEVPTWSPRTQFRGVYGDGGRLRSGTEGRLSVEVPPLSVQVYRAGKALAPRREAPAVHLTTPSAGGVVGGRAEIRASVPEDVFAQVTLAYRPVGAQDWTVLGTDDNAPYRVFHDVSGLADGTLLEYRAVLKDSSGNVSASSGYGVVGEPAPGGGDGGPGPVGPVEQPGAVSVPGSSNTEMGCAGDWAPGCDQAQLSLDAKDGVWKGTYDGIPAGDWEYKAAVNRSWDENYGARGVRNGANIPWTSDGGRTTFYYDHARHYVTSDAEGPVVTAPGSMQSELGCPGDWSPDCMLPWLTDADGDGTYTFSTTQLPPGTYETKVAHGLSWEENYGRDGVPGGSNISFSVPSAGVVTTFSYVLATHVLTVSTSEAGTAPDLGTARAHWLAPDLLAWPADGTTGPELLDWRLHHATDGGLAVDAETVTGGPSVPLTHDPAGLPATVLERFPHLEGYLALRPDRATARAAGDILTGQVAVAMYDDLGRLRDATGVQVPGVLDALYAERAGRTEHGISWRGPNPTLRLWAPTAQDVDLLLWPSGSADDAEPRRVPMTRGQDGSWSAGGTRAWTGMEYLYEVAVYAPSTGRVETNRVTDPWSVALTLDSTRSVVVDLADRRWQPQVWRTATAPALRDEVDQTIYELHVRDFSMSDPDVPEELRGSYLAFAEDGHGRRHLEALAEAGLNTVHLLPTFDIASIPETTADAAATPGPGCDLPSLPPDSADQQACVMAQADEDAFNWGYDPWHFMAPEGSYASTTRAAEGGQRVAEFRTMVGALHESGLRVVLDKVFNHGADDVVRATAWDPTTGTASVPARTVAVLVQP